jgi:hypothetical protein
MEKQPLQSRVRNREFRSGGGSGRSEEKRKQGGKKSMTNKVEREREGEKRKKGSLREWEVT